MGTFFLLCSNYLFYMISEISFKFSSAIKASSSSCFIFLPFLVTHHSNPMKTSNKKHVEKKCAESFACIYYFGESEDRHRGVIRCAMTSAKDKKRNEGLSGRQSCLVYLKDSRMQENEFVCVCGSPGLEERHRCLLQALWYIMFLE